MNIDKLLSSSLDDIVKHQHSERQRGRGRRGGQFNNRPRGGASSTSTPAIIRPLSGGPRGGRFRGRGRERRGGGQVTNRAFYRAVEQTTIEPRFQRRRRNIFGRRGGGGDRRGPGGRPLGPGVTVVGRIPRGALVGGSRQGVLNLTAGRKVNGNRSIQKRLLVPNTRFINTSLARRGEFANTSVPRRERRWITPRDSELLKKIKIVAELDRVPPPLSAQQSGRVTRSRAVGAANNSNLPVTTMTLNERFRR